MTIFVFPLLITFFALVGMVLRNLFLSLASKASQNVRTLKIRRTLKLMGAWITIYGLILLGASLVSSPSYLHFGERKCFDEWCFTTTSAVATPEGYKIAVAASNRGHHAQRPDSPQLSVILDGQIVLIHCPQIKDRVEAGEVVTFDVYIPIPTATKNIELLVTEGGFPSRLTIDDENSPFHAKRTWKIR